MSIKCVCEHPKDRHVKGSCLDCKSPCEFLSVADSEKYNSAGAPWIR
jgi:hypothetical protein